MSRYLKLFRFRLYVCVRFKIVKRRTRPTLKERLAPYGVKRTPLKFIEIGGSFKSKY